MTTAATFGRTTVYESISYQDALLDVVGRARDGDAEALAYVFDNVFYDVYHQVFLITRDRQAAESATRRALDRLPSMLRSRRFETLTELRDSLARRAAREVHDARRERPAAAMSSLRAGVRHFVLAATASIAAVSALVLAI